MAYNITVDHPTSGIRGDSIEGHFESLGISGADKAIEDRD